MMRRYQYGFWIIIGSLILSGCQLIDHTKGSNTLINDQSAMVIEQPPKIVQFNWDSAFAPLVAELLQTVSVTNNRLLISDIKNRTDHYISSSTVNQAIFNQFANQTIFNVVDLATVNQAKRVLGITNDDELISRSKMIALARQTQADYVLFTTINREASLPDISADVAMELLSTKIGEIVWQFASDQILNDQNSN